MLLIDDIPQQVADDIHAFCVMCASRVSKEHITSLCDEGAIHHYGEAITSLRLAATSLFTNAPKCAIINSERWWEYEEKRVLVKFVLGSK